MDPLDHLKPADGCSMDWKQMAGDEKVRHCSRCEKKVHHLSEMTRSEANALLASGGGKLCLALLFDAEGRVVSRPEPPPPNRWPSQLQGVLAFASGLVLAGCASLPPLDSPSIDTTCTPPAPGVKEVKSPAEGLMALGDEGVFRVGYQSLPPDKQGTKR